MKKSITLLLACFLIFNFSQAQQSPCLPVPGGVPAGNEAPGCMLCSPVYNGSTAGYSASAPGSAGFPCGTIENNQFLSIQVDASGSLSANILSSNCQNGQGIEIMIYDQNFNPISNCFSSGGVPLPGNVQASGLTPGEIYWIMIDGYAGDICEVTITIFGGANFTPPAAVGDITSTPDTTLCPGASACYSINTTQTDVHFVWDVPGNAKIVSGGGINDKEVCLEYVSAGGGVVRVTPTTICHNGIPSIFPVSVLPSLPDIRPVQNFCISDFPLVIDGNIFETPGSFTITHKTALNCDSSIVYTLLAYLQIPAVFDTTICQGEVFSIAGQDYSQPGGYQIRIPNASTYGCDSIVNFQIIIPDNQTEILKPDTLDCLPGSTVQLTSINYPVTSPIRWSKGTLGNYIPGATSATVTVDAAGLYFFESEATRNGKTCFAIDTVEVIRRPTPVAPPLDTILDYSCRQDTAIFLFDARYQADSLLWTFAGLDTFKTVWNDTFKYSAPGYFDSLRIQGENYCGVGNSTDTTLTLRPISPPGLDFFTADVCVNDTIFLAVPPLAANVNFQWNLNGGDLIFSGKPDTFGIIWNSTGIKTVGINTVQDTCYSGQVFDNVEVLAPLDLDIRCQPEIDRILFSWNKIARADSYIGRVVTGQNFTQTDSSLLVTGLMPDEQVSIELEISGSHPCGISVISKNCKAENCPGYALTVNPVSKICFDGTNPTIQMTAQISPGATGGTYEWSGAGVNSAGSFSPTAVGIGTHQINLKYTEGSCEYFADEIIEIAEKPTVVIDFDSPICLTENGLINYAGSASPSADFNWNFGRGMVVNGSGLVNYEIKYPTAGTYDFTLQVEENGCLSNFKTSSIEVEKPLDPILNNCSFTVSGVVFDWADIPDATGYSVNSISGQTGILNGSSYTVTGLSPGEEVTAEITAGSNNSCPDVSAVLTCEAANCPPVNVTIDQPATVCLDGGLANTIQLRARRNGIFRPGNYSWSGSNVSPSGVFDPNSVGGGIHPVSVVLTEGVCDYFTTIDVAVFEKPSANFSFSTPICITDNASVVYTGTAVSGANFNWNFGNANIVNSSGSTNYEINYPADGSFDLSLEVEENGCVSDVVTQNIQVDAELATPQVRCVTSTSEITFEWDAVIGALAMEAVSLSGQSPDFSTALSTTFSGLSPNERVEILVRADGVTVCGASESTLACVAKICPAVTLNIDPIPQPICAGDSINILLSANPIGGVGSGNYAWSGANATTDGMIDITQLSAGRYTVNLNYEEDNCRFSETITFDIESTPELSADVISPLWFPGVSGGIDLTVQTGLPPYSYGWDNTAVTEDLSGAGPGKHCVTVTDAKGCETVECFFVGSGNYRVAPIHLMCEGESKIIAVRPGRGASFSWFPSNGLSCDNCSNPKVSPSKSTIYELTATTTTGRVGTTKVAVIVLPPLLCQLAQKRNQLSTATQTEDLISLLTEGMDLNNLSNADLKKIDKKAEKLFLAHEVNIVPNPSSGEVNVLSNFDIQKVEVFDLSRRKVLENQTGKINLSAYPQGVYILKIKSEGNEFVKRLVLMQR